MKWLIAFTAALMLAVPARAEVDIEVVETDGGVTAWLVEEPSIPFVSLELRFQGGAGIDRPGKEGAVHLMMGLLEEGSGELDARGFTAATEALAAQFSFDTGDDSVSILAQFLNENRDEAVALLKAALTQPTFAQEDIDRVRAQVISIIRSDQQDPDTIASEAFMRMVFGDHPYGRAMEGTLTSVAALTRDDIVQAHRDAFVRDRAYASAAGDITAQELAALLDDLLGDLPESSEAPLPAPIAVETSGGIQVVDLDTPQSVAIFGHAGVDRDDEDFFAAYVMNEIMGGGGFDARLMTEVREKRGLTYGVYSYLVPKDAAALYLGQVASANDRIGDAIDVIRDQWQDLAENGVTPEELETAKTYLTGAYPLRFDGNSSIARILVGMQMDDLSPDYVNTRNDKVRALTVEDIQRVAARLVQPDALTFVVVGAPEGLESTVTQ